MRPACSACPVVLASLLPLLGRSPSFYLFFFFFTDPATTEIYTLSLHDALPILCARPSVLHTALSRLLLARAGVTIFSDYGRSEEHTSELQSPVHLVCRLLLEKKKTQKNSFSIMDSKKTPYSLLPPPTTITSSCN